MLAPTISERRLSVLQLDPSLFTAPYDAALAGGLAAAGVDSRWPSRPLRAGEEDPLGARRIDGFFYPLTEGLRRRQGAGWRLAKGVEHTAGLARFARLAGRAAPDLVHVQWAPLPLLDRRALGHIRRRRPVVLTVHDIKPFNGRPVSGLQRRGYDALLREADHLIVHTEAGRAALLARGIEENRVSVVPHGLLPLPDAVPEPRPGSSDARRWRILLFGRLQPYKGADVAIEALGRLAPAVRDRIELVVAGEAQMATQPLRARADALGLGHSFTLREGRLDDAAMAALLRSADAFVFPYRTIDASGVLHLVASLGRWMIASDLAAFRTMLGNRPRAGTLVAPGDADALAAAFEASIERRPEETPDTGIDDWATIGRLTRTVYEQVLMERAAA